MSAGTPGLSAAHRIRDQTEVAMLLAEQFLDFATGLADDCCVLDGGLVALASSAADLDRTAVHELLAV
jgi:ABC-type branched-subunit amino acid transport system ATPase component